MINSLPPPIVNDALKYFSSSSVHDAFRYVRLSRVSVSFVKEQIDNYFIVSGIIKDDRTHETKIVYKKRLEGSDEGPLSSNCDCAIWKPTTHCPHAIALYLTYQLQKMRNDGENQTTSHFISGSGVVAKEFGTIIKHAAKLEGALPNASFGSLSYQLTNNKCVPFNLPKHFTGHLILNLTTVDIIDPDSGDLKPSLYFKFSLQKSDLGESKEISIFESSYIFNWNSGEVLALPDNLREIIKKLSSFENLEINDILQFCQNALEQDELIIKLNDQLIDDITITDIYPQFTITPSDKRGNVDLLVCFNDSQGNRLQLPTLFRAATFIGGRLNSFKKKGDSYEFIKSISEFFRYNHPIKKNNIPFSARDYWSELINHTKNNKHDYCYSAHSQRLIRHSNNLIIKIFNLIVEYFDSDSFRFSQYLPVTKELQLSVSTTKVFQSIKELYRELTIDGLTLYYDQKEISKWSSRVRFERRSSETKWFDLELNLSQEDLQVIKNADIESGVSMTKSGLVLLTDDQLDLVRFLKKYTQYEKKDSFITEDDESIGPINKFIIPFNRARIFELFELKRLGLDGGLTPEEEQLCQHLSTFNNIPEYPVPITKEQSLRPYQIVGYRWLRFLFENKLGACLADDMGLGKTAQTIAFITSIYEQINKVLIVCPVSLLLNWEKEIKKFSDLNIHIYHGDGRSIPSDSKIILTSYGVMKKDTEKSFTDLDLDILILDEVQNLKNIKSLGSLSARKLKADFRICLTGTPVENDLSEFYNIIDLSLPGIWGDLHFIKTTSTKKSRLIAKKTAAPFILRRTKAQVLNDLPPKIDNPVYLEFNSSEKQSYAKLLMQTKEQIKNAPSKKKYGEILRGLLYLRQSCLWQKKFNPENPLSNFSNSELSSIESVKVEFLIDTLSQIIPEGHQVLIFSQFTSYLDIIQSAVAQKHWKYVRIDGSQNFKKRQEQVDIFQEKKAPIFLISLKAGGTGLNLTAASYVFIMDPWWNPAVENQAIDRAHRIGQENQLNVFRLIVKDSVEEKVLALQQYKKELFNDLLPENEEDYFQGKLSMKDFEHLFD